MKAIELTDEQYKALMNGQSITIDPPKPKPKKWEPKGGDYYIDTVGRIFNYTSCEDCKSYGTERSSPELCEQDLPEMWLHNRLLAWRAEHDGLGGDRTCEVYRAYNSGRAVVHSPTYPGFGTVLMSETAAKKLADYINDGIFDLEPPK